MPVIKVNTDEIKDAFQVIPIGRYDAKLIDVEEGDSSRGNPMLTWYWEVVDGEYTGAELRSYTVLEGDGRARLKEHLAAFGISGEVNMNTSKLIGKKVTLDVSTRLVDSRNNPGEKREVNQVARVLKLEGKSRNLRRSEAPPDDDEGPDPYGDG